jgi:hypothetical protein
VFGAVPAVKVPADVMVTALPSTSLKDMPLMSAQFMTGVAASTPLLINTNAKTAKTKHVNLFLDFMMHLPLVCLSPILTFFGR